MYGPTLERSHDRASDAWSNDSNPSYASRRHYMSSVRSLMMTDYDAGIIAVLPATPTGNSKYGAGVAMQCNAMESGHGDMTMWDVGRAAMETMGSGYHEQSTMMLFRTWDGVRNMMIRHKMRRRRVEVVDMCHIAPSLHSRACPSSSHQ